MGVEVIGAEVNIPSGKILVRMFLKVLGNRQSKVIKLTLSCYILESLVVQGVDLLVYSLKD